MACTPGSWQGYNFGPPEREGEPSDDRAVLARSAVRGALLPLSPQSGDTSPDYLAAQRPTVPRD